MDINSCGWSILYLHIGSNCPQTKSLSVINFQGYYGNYLSGKDALGNIQHVLTVIF